MFFLLSLFLFSSLALSPLKSSYQLPEDFVKTTIKYIRLDRPFDLCPSQKKCAECTHFQYINQIFSENLYYFAFTVEPEELTHLLMIINDLKKSKYLLKETLTSLQIKNILHLSPNEYQECFYPTPSTIKLSPSQKRRDKAHKVSLKEEDPLRNARNYYHLLEALQEAIDFLLYPRARMLLEKNFVTDATFNFNSFIQFFGHKKSALEKKLKNYTKEDHCIYFAKDKYGKHHFYEVKARTLRLFKKIITLYLKEMSSSKIYQNSEESILFFSEKKRLIQNSLKKAHFLLTSILPHDRLLLEMDSAISPRFYNSDYYKKLLNEENSNETSA